MSKKKSQEGISAKKEENIAEWYEQVCLKSELADFGSVKGTMVIRPNGYAIWQAIQDYFNKNINKPTGVRNAYFPLFIPESFFQKESQHAKGFSPEVAWLDKKVTGEGERLAIRPTSETIMYDSYSKWIRSWKDLPLKINQWCNVVRWETEATKLFLRSREFLWQEGHCVYETEEEAKKDAINYINLYAKLCKELLSLPVIVGKKTEKEKFAGAETTYTIEALMPDGKALQCGTSHELSQGFAKAFNIKFLGRDEKPKIPYQNSWGISTRLIGAVVMTHSDDKGLVLPSNLVENKVVIVPILFDKTKSKVLASAKKISKSLQSSNPILDEREEYSPGWKFNEWELKGIPIRIEIGPKDLQKNQVTLVRRDNGKKQEVKIKDVEKAVEKNLKDINSSLYKKAEKFLKENIKDVKNIQDLIKAVKEGKMAKADFCGSVKCEESIKDKSKGAGARVMPFDDLNKKGKCISCGKASKNKAIFSRSY